MNYPLGTVAVAALGWCQILISPGQGLAQTGMAAPAVAQLGQASRLWQTHAIPTSPVRPASATNQVIGLPKTRDYEPIQELRDIYFDFREAAIRPSEVRVLNANAAWLRAHPHYLLLIEGHCDNRGATSRKNEFNVDLGERRAEAAMNHLITQGVHPGRITILSYGEERPQCAEESERCWSQNRRSRFLVKPQ
jgi:peptidoglycan-associated lipoprotein